jgi:hypothetical protein
MRQFGEHNFALSTYLKAIFRGIDPAGKRSVALRQAIFCKCILSSIQHEQAHPQEQGVMAVLLAEVRSARYTRVNEAEGGVALGC